MRNTSITQLILMKNPDSIMKLFRKKQKTMGNLLVEILIALNKQNINTNKSRKTIVSRK